jgi:chromate transporter
MNISLTRLFFTCCLFSLMAVGGANALIPEMHREVVEVNGWMSSTEFASLFAIAQAAPGPNMLIISLIGWKVAGIAGAVVSTVAMCGPSSLLAFGVGRLLQRFHDAPWRRIIERGLAPITIGLVLGSGCLLAKAANTSWPGYVLTAASVILALRTKLNPLWLLAGGALIGLTGWI